MNKHSKKIIDELCNYLGYELDDCMCKELHGAVSEDRELQAYIDSVKKTIKICKEVYKEENLPESVKQDLLSKIKSRKSGNC